MAERNKRKKQRKSSKNQSEKSMKQTSSRKKSLTKKKSSKGHSHSSKQFKETGQQPVEKSGFQKVVSGIFNLLFYVITIGLILSAIIFAFNDSEEKNLMGYQVFNVKTNSMVPRDPSKQKGGFKAGDVIIIKRMQGSEVKEGDIVTFHPNKKSPTYLTHRVVKVVDELNGLQGPFMITQGDANLTEDSPTPVDQVVGKKVFAIPKLGVLLQFVREHLIVTIVFIISLFGSILLLKVYLDNPAGKAEKNKRSSSKRKAARA